MNSFIPFFFCIFVFVTTVNTQNNQPKFRILAPQFICGIEKENTDKNSTSLPISKPGATTIRLQAAFGQKLEYNWTVRFKVIDGPRDQRFNLLVWRAVRNLEKTLVQMKNDVALSSIVAINNSMLVDGVDYVFYVSGSNDKGEFSEMKSFSIKFQDADSEPQFDLSGDVTSEQFSVLMLGADTTYVDVPYIIESHVIPCKPTLDYFFHWTITDLSNNNRVNVGVQKGKKLIIPPGKLIGGRQYDIHCTVLKISNKTIIAEKGIFINTKKRGLSLEMNVYKLKMATNTPITLIAIIKNSDNTPGILNIHWKCKIVSENKDCDNFKTSNVTEITLEGGLQKDGEYEFQVNVIKGNESASQKCYIITQNAMIPTIELNKAFILAVSRQYLEIQARVLDLRSGCKIEWTSVKEKGFAFINNEFHPGNLGKVFATNSMDETFLSEIVEFGNETLNKNYPLSLPSFTESWSGLIPNIKYKFRLLMECMCTFSIECEGPKNISAYSDVIVQTNEAPVPTFIKVKPINGIGLITVFQFFTSAATDLLSDYPLTYIFGYKILNETTIIATFVENLVVETILPYSNKPITPTLKVCDSRRACLEILGESVITSDPKISSMNDLKTFIEIFRVNMFRKEYFDGFKLISAVVETLKVGEKHELSTHLIIDIENITTINIQELIEEIIKNKDISTTNDLISIVTKFIEKFSVSESFIQDVLKLRDKVFEIINQSSSRIQLYSKVSYLKMFTQSNSLYKAFPICNKKNRYKRDLSSEDISNLLKVSEYIILTSKDKDKVEKEKNNVLSNVQISIKELCKNEKKDISIIDTQIVAFGVEKTVLKSNFVYNVPYTENMGNTANESMIIDVHLIPKDINLTSNIYCLAKSLYFLKMFDYNKVQHGWTYEINIFDLKLNTLSSEFEIILKIPILEDLISVDKILKCHQWISNEWSELTCETSDKYLSYNNIKHIKCRCNSLGVFGLYETEVEKTTEISINTEYSSVTENSFPITSNTEFEYTESINLNSNDTSLKVESIGF